MKIDFYEIEDMGEESGREEASDDFPFLPQNWPYRFAYWWGRGRAQGLYALRGKAARRFAQAWAIGYQANCALFEREYPDELRRARSEEEEVSA